MIRLISNRYIQKETVFSRSKNSRLDPRENSIRKCLKDFLEFFCNVDLSTVSVTVQKTFRARSFSLLDGSYGQYALDIDSGMFLFSFGYFNGEQDTAGNYVTAQKYSEGRSAATDYFVHIATYPVVSMPIYALGDMRKMRLLSKYTMDDMKLLVRYMGSVDKMVEAMNFLSEKKRKLL